MWLWTYLTSCLFIRLCFLLCKRSFITYEGWLISSWPSVDGEVPWDSHYMHVQFNYLSDKAASLKLKNFCGISVLCHRKLQVSTVWDIGKFVHNQGLQNLNSLHTCPVLLMRHPQRSTSSLRWSRSSVVAILTVMTMSLLLGSTFSRSKMLTSPRRDKYFWWTLDWVYKCREGLCWK